MKKTITGIVLILLACIASVSVYANPRPLNAMLRDLKGELHTAYTHIPQSQAYFDDVYEDRHQKMLEAISNSSGQSILLYTQESHMTFNMTYALDKVAENYKAFNETRQPYEQGVEALDFNIERYARLVEALRRLPPQIPSIQDTILPDSLLYHNDSLDIHFAQTASSLEKEIVRLSKDTSSTVFVLDEKGKEYRDSCIFYASEVLKMYAASKAKIDRDSIHYQEAYLRMKENYDYAEQRYQELQDYIFSEGQLPYWELLGNFSMFRKVLQTELQKQYDLTVLTAEEGEELNYENLSSQGARVILIFICVFQLLALFLFWLVVLGISWLILRFVKNPHLKPKQLPLFSILVGTILYLILFDRFWTDYEYIQMGVNNINTFLWLLIAFNVSMLLRVKPDQIRHGVFLYLPLFVLAFVIIIARNTFLPDSLLVLIFPPVMFLIIVRQMLGCVFLSNKVSSVDARLGWASLFIYIIAFGFAFWGYTFVGLLILIWWYFQLTVLLTLVCISELLNRYKTKWLDHKVNAMRERITYVTGNDRESLLFGATWLYDLIREVAIPMMLVISLPLCARLSLDIFDFTDLYVKYFTQPFISIPGDDGGASMCISAKSIVYLIALFLVLKYIDRVIHALWQYFRYTLFMRKNNRKSIRANEINLSLGNSLITVMIWMIFVVVVVQTWKIPTGSLALVAGGLSAGIGLSLKDIINNFIYGIQLLGGRLRVGDWIECEGVRGKVTAINYQCVQVETLEGTEMSFLNASLFGKNFNNLTRNNSYEKVKVYVGVAYGTDIQKVREVLQEAMKQMQTKDHYGRDVVEPQYGIKVMVDEMSDSAVTIAVTQYVLVAERLPYLDRAKEVVYNALNEAGIKIPFPQCDVHIIPEGE